MVGHAHILLFQMLADGERGKGLKRKSFRTWADGICSLRWEEKQALIIKLLVWNRDTNHQNCLRRWHVDAAGALWFPSSLQSGGWARLVSSAQGGSPTSGPGPGDGAVRWVRGPHFYFTRQSEVKTIDIMVGLEVMKTYLGITFLIWIISFTSVQRL